MIIDKMKFKDFRSFLIECTWEEIFNIDGTLKAVGYRLQLNESIKFDIKSIESIKNQSTQTM